MSSTPYGLYAVARRNYIPYEHWGANLLISGIDIPSTVIVDKAFNRNTESQSESFGKMCSSQEKLIFWDA